MHAYTYIVTQKDIIITYFFLFFYNKKSNKDLINFDINILI